MTGSELREKYLKFFEDRGHLIIPSAPLVPENDPTTLFISSGKQPLIPYLLGQPHPSGKTRLVNSQKSFRAQDIEEVGDNRHTTFFEMLGNWSLGDYFKKDQLSWVWEFLTEVVGLPQDHLQVTLFAGNDQIPKDTESHQIWQSLGLPDDHIHFYDAKKNWWSRSGTPEAMPAGEPGGPDSEVFYDFGAELKLHQNSPWKDQDCHVNCDCGRYLEIGNSVFMQYQKQADGSLKELPKRNVDFGGGLERILAAKNDDPDIFTTDLFWPIIKEIETLTNRKYEDDLKEMRIIADHLKAATFMIAEGIEPSNKQQGYLLRRLIRRAAVKYRHLTGKIPSGKDFQQISQTIITIYPNHFNNPDLSLLDLETAKFAKTLDQGLKQINTLSPFDLYQTYGFPIEITQELYHQQGKQLDRQKFDQELEQHQKLSRTASKGMFKGGLQDHSETVTKYHTATHLLHQVLRQILGDHVHQTGSNITNERLRFDFTHPQALTGQELQQVESLVNSVINQHLPVTKATMTLKEAQAQGALAFFSEKYGNQVTVYSIGSFSKEVCGGPHVINTDVIGPIQIYKQESIGSGKRRLYARLSS